ncbi:hypothetical protein [Bacillus cereus]|uniref:hypothetical protein n=1 Tax=Bacillus cereus TaxID=1396 RepID=UPI000D0EAB15|nr:hypothetical protein [Bacillus cereus]AVP48419.1 hypothetical protein C2I25_26635 [Bacillus cereus]
MGEITWGLITKVAPISGFIGAIIVLVVNTYFTNKGKKAGVRSYVEVVRASADPELDKGVFKTGSKMILTDELEEHLAKSKEDGGIIPDALKWRPNFLRVNNISANPCFGMKIKGVQKIQKKPNLNETFIDLELYALKGGDEIYIPLKSINSTNDSTIIIEIEYKTLANERMLYKNEMVYKDGELDKIVQSIYVVKWWWRNEKVVHTTVSNVEWKTIK